MSNDGVVTSFEEKLRARQAKLAAEKQAKAPAPNIDYSEDVPELDYTPDPEQQAVDEAIERLGIVEAYNKWCGKMHANPANRRKEGIKVSCPNPAHPDKNPSSWLNTDKNVYYCGGCAEGGDIWDIAAYHFGFSVPSYKTDGTFRQLREKIAVDLGFAFVKGMNQTYVVPPNAEEEQPQPQKEETTSVALLPSGAAHEAQEKEYTASFSGPEVDWRSIIPKDTFLREWLDVTTKDDCPEEYHVWTGLMAIGYAVGRNVVLNDSPPVVANLYVCLVGPSGAGKSRAKRHLRDALSEVMPYDDSNPFTMGTKLIGAAGSGEYLVSTFSSPIEDPGNPKKILGFAPVRGYIDYEEFASLVATAGRAGSTLKQGLMDIYDAQKHLAGGSLTHGKRTAENPFGQVISTTQNGSLANLINKKDDTAGFINRWIFASGKLKPARSWGGVPVNLTRPNEFLKAIHIWGSTHKGLDLTEDAFRRWDEFFHSTLHPTKMMAEKNGSAMLNRIDLLLKKLMLLLACNLKQSSVTLDIVEQAIALYPYLLATYGVVNKEIKRTDEVDQGELVIDQVKRLTAANGLPPSKRDIYNSIKNKFNSYDQLAKVLKNLVTLELIVEEPYKPKVGRPTVRYAVND